jgi:hypothetical protein
LALSLFLCSKRRERRGSFVFEKRNPYTIDHHALSASVSVYCDHFVQDAVKKNEVMRAKNAKMEDARHRLIHMKIYKHICTDELVEINLQKPTKIHQQENVNHYVYEVDSAGVELRYTNIPRLYYEISGACLEDCIGLIMSRPQRIAPKLILHANETLQLEFYVSDEVKITVLLGRSNRLRTLSNIQISSWFNS